MVRAIWYHLHNFKNKKNTDIYANLCPELLQSRVKCCLQLKRSMESKMSHFHENNLILDY